MASSSLGSDAVLIEKYRRAFKIASFIGLVQLGGLAVYLLVAEIIRAQQKPFLGFLSSSLSAGNRPVIRYAVFAASIASLLFLRFIHGRSLRKLSAFDDRDKALNHLFRSAVIDVVLAEVPALLGMILFLAAGVHWDLYVLLFVSLVLLFIYLPRLKNWEDILQNRPVSCPR